MSRNPDDSDFDDLGGGSHPATKREEAGATCVSPALVDGGGGMGYWEDSGPREAARRVFHSTGEECGSNCRAKRPDYFREGSKCPPFAALQREESGRPVPAVPIRL
jgi:hypothetical protein